jgi:hypothetical protein
MHDTSPEQGQLVCIRQRQWVVSEVTQNSLPLMPLQALHDHQQHLVTLSSIEDNGLGDELR